MMLLYITLRRDREIQVISLNIVTFYISDLFVFCLLTPLKILKLFIRIEFVEKEKGN